MHATSYTRQVLAQVVVLSFQVERGTLTFYTLQLITWCKTVAKTYPRAFISEVLFFKWPRNLEICFYLSTYKRDICKGEIKCLQKYLLITPSQDMVTNFLLHHSLYEVVDGNTETAYCNPCLVENKKISMNICIKSARFCLDNFRLKIPLEQRHVPLLSLTHGKM